MNDAGPLQVLVPELAAALDEKGYTTLTPVQEAVLAPELAGRDLRISSQTGSGKTVAIGFVVYDILAGPRTPGVTKPAPRVLVIVPTRELAKQVEGELGWLYARLKVGVTSVTGGANYTQEHRALARDPGIVVGTPGRLLDHLQRGSLDASRLGAVVLDEADRMFDMGFQEDLESLFAFAPKERRTYLMSATFPREVLRLADRVQVKPVHVEATPLGVANADIEHVAHFVEPNRRLDALVNLLLSVPDARTIVFAKTRADVADVADALAGSGFQVGALSGEMEQRERNRSIEGFKQGRVLLLVATDVAARGLDVQNVAQVIHLEPPTDADTYTHRSGRTGRAGNKGRSVMLVTPSDMFRAQRVARNARVSVRFDPLPSAEALHAAQADRVVKRLTERLDGENENESGLDARTQAIVERLLAAGSLELTIARLVAQSGIVRGPVPRDVRTLPMPDARGARPRALRGNDAEPPRGRTPAGPAFAGPRSAGPGAPPRHHEADTGRPPRTLPPSGWVAFRVTWGESHGADARRLLAMVCRRGGIASSEVGRIHVGRYASDLEVSSGAAAAFEAAASQPDPRDPRVSIERNTGASASAPSRMPRPPRPPARASDAPPPARRSRSRAADAPAPSPEPERVAAPRRPRTEDAPPRAPRGGNAPPKPRRQP